MVHKRAPDSQPSGLAGYGEQHQLEIRVAVAVHKQVTVSLLHDVKETCKVRGAAAQFVELFACMMFDARPMILSLLVWQSCPCHDHADRGVVDNGDFGEGVTLCEVGKIDDPAGYALSAVGVSVPRVTKDGAKCFNVLIMKTAIFNRCHGSSTPNKLVHYQTN